MKKILTLILICSTLISKADYWTQKADYPGGGLAYAFSFSIGNKGYVGCGTETAFIFHNDFWEYDPATNAWTQKANFGGSARYLATGFSIGNKGYVVSGGSMSLPVNDFWEYDVTTNAWTQKNFSGVGGRLLAFSFSIGSKGYFGTGINDLFLFSFIHHDFWEYNSVTDSWTQKADVILASGYYAAMGFSIGSKGYFGTGIIDAIGTPSGYFFEYDTAVNTWTQKANVLNGPWYHAAGFNIGTKGYMGTGQDVAVLNFYNFNEYNPVTDTWTLKAHYPGLGNFGTVGFSIDCKGYLGIGMNWINSVPYYYHDFWEYTPDSACATGIEEHPTRNLEFTIFPNPAKEFIVISYPLAGKENLAITITNVEGKKVYETTLQTTTLNFKLQTLNFKKGIYFVAVNNGKQKAVKKFVKE